MDKAAAVKGESIDPHRMGFCSHTHANLHGGFWWKVIRMVKRKKCPPSNLNRKTDHCWGLRGFAPSTARQTCAVRPCQSGGRGRETHGAIS